MLLTDSGERLRGAAEASIIASNSPTHSTAAATLAQPRTFRRRAASRRGPDGGAPKPPLGEPSRPWATLTTGAARSSSTRSSRGSGRLPGGGCRYRGSRRSPAAPCRGWPPAAGSPPSGTLAHPCVLGPRKLAQLGPVSPRPRSAVAGVRLPNLGTLGGLRLRGLTTLSRVGPLRVGSLLPTTPRSPLLGQPRVPLRWAPPGRGPGAFEAPSGECASRAGGPVPNGRQRNTRPDRGGAAHPLASELLTSAGGDARKCAESKRKRLAVD